MPAPGDPHFDWVAPGLAIGGCVPTDVALTLARRHAVRLVVDLREEGRDDGPALAEAGAQLLHLPTPDNAAIAPSHLTEGVHRLRQVRGRGEAGLVHCQHGIGRSALLALCVLVDHGMAPLDALVLLKGARERISPSPAQYEAWADWLHRRDIAPPAFESFAAVAYRHLAPA
jgi:protein-tyrosine phosphatase